MTTISKKKVWEELDDDYDEGFRENYEDYKSFRLTYCFEDELPKIMIKWVKRWALLFNKNSKSPYFAFLTIGFNSYSVNFTWEGFQKYTTAGKEETAVVN